MTLELPNLDDRTFEDLLGEVLELIPTYTPEWTDFNDSDPGVTLLQMWAHLVEVMLNRLNLLPERAHLTLLNLLGVRRRPGFPARAHVTFEPIATAPQASIPVRTALQASPDDGGPPLTFETSAPLDPVMRPLAVLQRIPLTGTPESLTDRNEPGSPEFTPFGLSPQIDDAVYFGFEERTPNRVFSFPSRIVLRFFETSEQASDSPVQPGTPLDSPPVDLVWEYRLGPSDDEWRSLDTVRDETLGLTTPGYVEIKGPGSIGAIEKLGVAEPPHYWIRCRLAGGSYPTGKYPRFGFVRVNTVEAEQLESVEGEIVGIADGRPGFSTDLPNAPIEPGSLVIETESAEGTTHRWQRVDSLSGAARDDLRYTLDPATGRITFGDGRHGRYPVAGSVVIARQYRWGGGSRGNVPAEAIQDIPSPIPGISAVTNHRRAYGGADPESVDELKARAAGEIRSGSALITSGDFESFVRGIGGVARAAAFAGSHPGHPSGPAPGSITVVVVPEPHGPAPQPSHDLRALVESELDKRRLITSQIHVVGPTYRTLSVIARVHAEDGASHAGVRRRVVEALDERLAPVRAMQGDGSEYTGWAFGADLVPTSLFAVMEAVDGVAAVPMLELSVDGRIHADLRDPVVLSPGELFALGDHSITVVASTDLDIRDSLP